MTEITDERRREVAARLRGLKPWSAEGDVEVSDVLAALAMDCGYTDSDFTTDSVNSLADLIDRPVCHDVSNNDEFFVCSVCGADADLSEFEIGNYCANCGAEVVG